MAQGDKRDEQEQLASEEGESEEQAYEPPRVEESPADRGLTVTAAGTSPPPQYGAIVLVEDDDDDEVDA